MRRSAVLALAVGLIAPAAVALADPRPPPATTCHGTIHTPHAVVTDIRARDTGCDTAHHYAHMYALSEHCRTNQYCSVTEGYHFSCAKTVYSKSPVEWRVRCGHVGGHAEFFFYWHRP